MSESASDQDLDGDPGQSFTARHRSGTVIARKSGDDSRATKSLVSPSAGTRSLPGQVGGGSALSLSAGNLLAMPTIDDDDDARGSTGVDVKRLESSASVASRRSLFSTAASVRGNPRRRRGSQHSDVSAVDGIRKELMAMSTMSRRGMGTRLESTIVRQGTSAMAGTIKRSNSTETLLLMQPTVREAAEQSEDYEAEEGPGYDQMEAPQLRAELEAQQAKVDQCIAMGQHLLGELEGYKEDCAALEQERDNLLDEFSDLEDQLEEMRKENDNLRTENSRIMGQVRSSKNQVSELQFAIAEQREVFQAEEMKWEEEREKLANQMQEAREDAQWHEGRVAEAIEIAEKKKPDLEALAEICSAFTTKATRKVFFQRLKDWRDDNKKKRHALAILLHNARTWRKWEDDTYNDCWRKLLVFATENARRKRHARSEIERREENNRADMVERSLRTVILFVTSAWRVCIIDSLHWHGLHRKQSKEVRKIRAQAQSDEAFFTATQSLEMGELTHRSELYQAALRTVMETARAWHEKGVRKWDEAAHDAASERRHAQQLRQLRDEEVDALTARANAHSQQGSTLRRKCDSLTSQVQEVASVARTHERELVRLREEVARLTQDHEASAAQLLERDKELALLRGQLEAQLTRTQRRAKAVGEEESLSPMLQSALTLAADLRKHAESTSAALSNRRIVSPYQTPRRQR